jgi:hypothetical protein
MFRTSRRYGILALGATALILLGLTACGEGLASGTAVRVGTAPIGTTEVSHWMSVIAGEVSTPAGQPAPVVPDPPRYTRCIAYRRRYPATFQTGSAATATLTGECQHEYEKEQLKALYTLITSVWVADEASELGVTLTGTELDRLIAADEEQTPQIRRFLVGARGTNADLRARVKLIALTAKIQQKLEAEPSQHQTSARRQRELNRFGATFERKWRARTTCRQQYSVPICNDYRPPRTATGLVPPAIPLTNLTAG